MKRIEKYKLALDHTSAQQKNNEQLSLTYQELMNQLSTYHDKKELTLHFENLKKGFKQVVCQ